MLFGLFSFSFAGVLHTHKTQVESVHRLNAHSLTCMAASYFGSLFRLVVSASLRAKQKCCCYFVCSLSMRVFISNVLLYYYFASLDSARFSHWRPVCLLLSAHQSISSGNSNIQYTVHQYPTKFDWYIQCRERERESYRINQTKSCEWRKSTQFPIDKRVFLQIVCVYSCWNSYLHILAIQVRFITPSIDLILFSFYFLLLFIINFFLSRLFVAVALSIEHISFFFPKFSLYFSSYSI